MPDQMKTTPQISGKSDILKGPLEFTKGELSGHQSILHGTSSDPEDQSFFEVANDAIVVHDLYSFQFIDVNPKFTEMFGYNLEEMRNGGIGLLGGRNRFYKESDVLQWLEQAAEGHSQIFEAEAWKKTGERVWMEVSLKRGRVRGQDCLLALIRDITDRKRAEEYLRESERKFRTLFDSSYDAVLMLDEQGIFDCNQKTIEMLGLSSKEELLGRNPGEFSPKFQADGSRSIMVATERIEKALQEGKCQFEWVHRRSDGLKIVSEILLNRLEIGGKKVIQALIRDIGERKRADEEIRKYQERLRTLALEISLLQERERRQIAIDLHDHIGQNLAFAKMKLGALLETSGDLGNGGSLHEVFSLVDQTIRDTRSLVFELSPPVLYELGFAAGIDWLVERFQKEHGIRVECEQNREPIPLDEDMRIVLFQIVRELLVNVAKHARADQVKVNIRRVRSHIRIGVTDNGIGFNPSLAETARGERGGFGLFSIRERMTYLGGELHIYSDARSGTRIILRAPLKQKRKYGGRKLSHEYPHPGGRRS
ncbi:MAG: PAS domain S-box protein [Syntrophaceae bacterium]|nr:PAS domain S-box protein [Syntrophaceae bacterium]